MAATTGKAKRKPHAEFGAMLSDALNAAGKSPGWLAVRLGVDPSMISRYRSGAGAPDNAKLALIVRLLDMDLEAACRACDRDPRAVEAVAVVASPGIPPALILEYADESLKAILADILTGNPAAAQVEAAVMTRLLSAAARRGEELAKDLGERQARATSFLIATLRETEVPETAPRRNVDLAPRALVKKSAPLISSLHSLADEHDSPAIQAKAHLASGHMHYVARDSVNALREFHRAMAYEAWMTDDDLLMALRTMALSAAYRVARGHPGGGRWLPDWARDHVEEIAQWTRRTRRRIEAGKYGAPHAAMTALEGVSRACGMVGLDTWFYDALSEAEQINERLESAGTDYPLPRVQRLYARLTVFKLRGERMDFDRVLREARSTVLASQYPRHRQQIEDIDKEWVMYRWGKRINARTKVAS